MKRIKYFAINGSFFLETRTGIGRYAEEIIKALDSSFMREEEVFRLSEAAINPVYPERISLIVSKKTKINFELKNIKIIRIGNIKKPILWEQTCFAFYCIIHKATPINLCNTAPLLKSNGISAIHDISYKVNPQFFTGLYGFLSRNWHKINYWFICKFTKKIITVSEFSKSEIKKNYGVNENKITVIPNAWQHFSPYYQAYQAAERSQVNSQESNYFFSMASVAKNKNFKWILEVAKKNPNQNFKIAGQIDAKRFGCDLSLQSEQNEGFAVQKNNVQFIGYIPDEQAKELIKNCKAFLFPSLYEGFGLPPLEALSLGAKIIVSDIPVFREIFGNSAHYIDPYNYNVNLEKLLNEQIVSANEVLEKFSWEKSAEKLKEVLQCSI